VPNILILTRYDQLGASSRLRILQFVPILESMGWDVIINPLLDRDHLRLFYSDKKDIISKIIFFKSLFFSYLKRFKSLLTLDRCDIVWIEKEIFPFLPSFFESILKYKKTPYVVDYDDAIFHNYDLNRNLLVRRFLGDKLKSFISSATAVTVGNDYLFQYARECGARRIERFPTVIDVERYEVDKESPSDLFRIGWIGSPSSSQYLPIIFSALQRLSKQRKIVFVTVGASSIEIPGVAIEQHDWSLETEVNLIQSFHVGIMPLKDSPWERGKCGYKLIQYMACGRPVVACPVGVNKEIVSDAVGYLANTDEEWFNALEELASDPNLRHRLGNNARHVVEQSYTKQVVGLRIENLLREHAGVVR
jgi:glycosyltransferase involved in cell wall biosynthesis